MEVEKREAICGEIDALEGSLALERHRHVAGIEPAPALAALFQRHSTAAHKDTVTALRAAGETALAERVAGLRAERASAEAEEAWRSAEVAATGLGPDGPLTLNHALLRGPRERDATRRRALGEAIVGAFAASAPHREAAAEARARARAEMGLLPDWQRVVEADGLLSATDDAYRDLLGWLARQHDLRPRPSGDLERTDLLHLLALESWSGLFPPGMLPLALRETLAPLRLDLRAIRIDDAERAARWPGAHAHGTRISVLRQGGAADWMGLLDAGGQALAAALGPRPSAQDPSLPFALGALLSGLLLDRKYLAQRLGVDAKVQPDLVRLLALRRLFALRARAAALRVAGEVERGTSGQAWREAYREAMALATLAAWPGALAAWEADGRRLLAGLRGAARAERLRRAWVERYDEDWWRNPRASEAVAGLLAGGWEGDEPSLGLAGDALAQRMERGG